MNNKKCKFVLKICAFTIMCIYNPAFAQVRNGDSVIERNFTSPISSTTSSSGTVTKNSATPQGRVEYTETACPSGYTGADGGSTFTTQQRMISSFVYNGTTRTSTGPWEAVTNDYCTRRETRSANCPSGQTGSATEARTITYNTSGYSYGSWATSSSTCTTPPPPACSPTSTTRSGSCTPVYGSGYTGTVTYRTDYTCNSSGNLVAGSEYYLTDNCRRTSSPPPVVQPPPSTVVCTASSWPNTYSCPAGTTGTRRSTSYNVCPNGPYSPGYQYEGPISGSCTPTTTPPPPAVICSPSSWPNSYSCPAGTTGTRSSTSYNVCPNGPYSPGYQYEGPVSGTCTPVYVPPPPPVGCWLNGPGYYASIGSIHGWCDVVAQGQAYPQGQSFRCTATGWANYNYGSTNGIYVYCE